MNRTVAIGCAAAVVVVSVYCGYLYGKRAVSSQTPAKERAQQSDYTCPMHPFIVKDKQGACAVCGMDMVKMISGTSVSDKELLHLSHVALSPTQRVLSNLATTVAAVKPFTREITATGIVTFNQERQGKVTAWTAGSLDRLLVWSVGSEVVRDRPVAEVFSLDLANAQEEYLLAYKAVKLFNSSIAPIYSHNNMGSLFEARQRLRQLGFKDSQFEQLEKSGKATVRIPIISNRSGVITEKFVQEGQYVNAGDPLFSVADLSRIWVELEAFERDLPFIRVGQEIVVVSQAYPGRSFHGKAILIYPFLDPKTRTVRIRVELPNPGMRLKPDMIVSGTIKIPMGASIVVPVGAVMDTGKRQVVWVESQPGVFVQRDVKAGARSGDFVQILSGLKAGEKVASSGGYLIDSEAQLSHGPDVTEPPSTLPNR